MRVCWNWFVRIMKSETTMPHNPDYVGDTGSGSRAWKKAVAERVKQRRCLYVSISMGDGEDSTTQPSAQSRARKCSKWAKWDDQLHMWVCPNGHGINDRRTTSRQL